MSDVSLPSSVAVAGGRIARAFAEARRAKRPLLVAYVMAGDPGIDASVEVALACARSGAGMIEVGVPFSDPIADGPTIAAAGGRAIARKTNLIGAFEVARRIRERTEVPLVLMGYANPFFKRGLEKLADDAYSAAVDGLLIPDLPFDHGSELADALAHRGIALPQLMAPTSTDARVTQVARAASGFLYYVSVTGVTGARDPDPVEVEAGVARVRALTALPTVVGFGLREPEQLRRLKNAADGFVVGSAIVDRAYRAASVDEAVSDVSTLVRSLSLALQ